MVPVTCLENFYERLLLSAIRRLRADGGRQPATCDSGCGYGCPGRFGAHPVSQGEPPAKCVNGKPVLVPGIRRAGRVIADRAFAVLRPACPWRKPPSRNIGGLRAYVEDEPVDIGGDRRRRVIHDQRKGLCSGRRAGPVNRRVPARAMAAELGAHPPVGVIRAGDRDGVRDRCQDRARPADQAAAIDTEEDRRAGHRQNRSAGRTRPPPQLPTSSLMCTRYPQ